MTHPRRWLLAGTAVTAALSLTACEKTTVVEVTTVPTTAVNATTTLPTGTPPELLVKLRDLAYTLGNTITQSGAEARYLLEQLDALWDAAKAQLPRTSFVESVAAQMDLLHVAVDRKRPADADKAALRMQSLVDAELPKLEGGAAS